MENFWEADLEKTVHDYSFTIQANQYMSRILDSDEFYDMDTEAVTRELVHGLRVYSFCDYLKRYVYQTVDLKKELGKSFFEVTDEEYKQILVDSFKHFQAPVSLSESKVRRSNAIGKWLTQDSARRSTVFVLGFGLGMNDKEVSEFLTKVLKEEDFDFSNPVEVIYWYCYHFGFWYSRALSLIEEYQKMQISDSEKNKALRPSRKGFSDYQIRPDNPGYSWEILSSRKDFANTHAEDLKRYLAYLKLLGIQDTREKRIYREFERLYDKSCTLIAEFMTREDEDGRHWRWNEIAAADVEKFLCSGAPVSKSGNITRKSSSLYSRHFKVKQLTRQNIEAILAEQVKPDRFDLITLQFLISSLEYEDLPPEKRLQYFMDEINWILERCRLHGLYSANPYECFLMLCLLSEDPLMTYSDILEFSYEEDL